jgi:hypothetical protein
LRDIRKLSANDRRARTLKFCQKPLAGAQDVDGFTTNILPAHDRLGSISSPDVEYCATRPVKAKAFRNLPAADCAAEIDVRKQNIRAGDVDTATASSPLPHSMTE